MMRGSDSLGKDADIWQDWRQEKGTTDETVGWHHQLNGYEFEQAPRVGDRQGSLVCCSPWGRKESDTTEWLNWTELVSVLFYNLPGTVASHKVWLCSQQTPGSQVCCGLSCQCLKSQVRQKSVPWAVPQKSGYWLHISPFFFTWRRIHKLGIFSWSYHAMPGVGWGMAGKCTGLSYPL